MDKICLLEVKAYTGAEETVLRFTGDHGAITSPPQVVNLGPGVSVSRSGTAYLSDGTAVAANLPRLEAGKLGQAILIEEATTNLTTDPFFAAATIGGNGGWYVNTYNAAAATCAVQASGGTFGAKTNKLTITDIGTGGAASNVLWGSPVQASGCSIGQVYSTRIRMRSIAAPKQVVWGQYRADAGPYDALASASVTLTPEWQDFTLTGTVAYAASSFGINFWAAMDATGIEIDALQTELKPQASSFIDGSRAAESLSVPVGTLLNAAAGTIEGWFHEATPYGATRYLLDATAGSGRLYLRAVGSAPNVAYEVGFNNAAALTSPTYTPAAGPAHLALVWSGAVVSLYRNGELAATATLAAPVDFSGVTTLYLGSSNAAASQLGGTVSDLRFAPFAKTAAAINSDCFSPLPVAASNETYLLHLWDAWQPRLIQPGNYKLDAFSDGTTFGLSRIGYGEVVLDNTDGGLDYLLDYGFDGRDITLLQGLPGGVYPSGYTAIYSATVEQIVFDWETITLRLRDNMARTQIPLPQTAFLGNNALPAGLEGVIADLKGKPKPIVMGQVFNISPPCCNTSKLIYCLSSGISDRTDSITNWDGIANFDALTNIFGLTGEGIKSSTLAVYDRGVLLTKGADYTDEGDLLANAPTAGQVRLYPGGSHAYIRLGSAPAGAVTVDCQDNSGATPYAGVLIRRLLETYLLWPASRWSQTDLDALDALAPYEIGYYVDAYTTVDTIINTLCNSIGACVVPDASGVLRFFRIDVPTAASVATLSSQKIYSVKRKSMADTGNGIPAWQVRLRYKPNYTPQTDVAGSAAERAAQVKEQWREVLATDATIRTAHILAPELIFETNLKDENATEAARRLTLYKYRRDRLELTMDADYVAELGIRIGSIVIPDLAGRYGYTTKKMLLLGMAPDVARNRITLTVWG